LAGGWGWRWYITITGCGGLDDGRAHPKNKKTWGGGLDAPLLSALRALKLDD
tara:strand:+ start:158 stop:313 length:156 start_codon:yes stop_codon:yes gene_type:complete